MKLIIEITFLCKILFDDILNRASVLIHFDSYEPLKSTISAISYLVVL